MPASSGEGKDIQAPKASCRDEIKTVIHGIVPAYLVLRGEGNYIQNLMLKTNCIEIYMTLEPITYPHVGRSYRLAL